MSVNWHDLLLVWLHDPPDQVLDLQGVLRRAARYARAACGFQYSGTPSCGSCETKSLVYGAISALPILTLEGVTRG